MKRSDLISIILIGVFGFGITFWACNLLLGDPNQQSVTFKTMNTITSDVVEPDVDLFNVNAINPTVEVYVGSCVDADQDGVLSEAEKAACNEIETR